MLTSSSKILHDNKRDFFRLNGPGSDQRIRERWCDADFKSAWARLRRCLLKDSLKRHFLDIYLTTFSECVNSEIQNLWGSSFFWNHLKFKLDFKNSTQNSQKIFCFWDNCIWISIVKLSLLGTGYFSSAANVLTSSPKIWHVNKREFFQLHFTWQWSMNIITVLWCRFQQCLGTFTMLLVEGLSETGLFRYLSDYVFGVPNIGNTKSMRVILLFKRSKI